MPIIDFIVSHYVLMILLAVATVINFVWLFFNRKDLKMNIPILIVFSLLHSIIGVLFVVIFAYIEAGFDFEAIGNMSLYGGVFFMPIVYLLYALIRKVSIGRAFDIFTISIVSTLFFARINCIISGCCRGILIGDTGIRVPTRELELLFYALFVIFTITKIYKKESNGYMYPIYMLSYGVFRFIVEFLREADGESIFHIGHIWSIISIVIGLGFILGMKYLRGKKNEKENIYQ